MRSIRSSLLLPLLALAVLSTPAAAADPLDTSPTMTTEQPSPSASVPLLEPKDLTYAATARCKGCGAGLAYAPDRVSSDSPFRMASEWDCSAVLLGEVTENLKDHPTYPFAFYEIKSEHQSPATTRPEDPKGQRLLAKVVDAERILAARQRYRAQLTSPDLSQIDRDVAEAEQWVAKARAELAATG
jgi:hypothetical protein